MGHFYLPDGSPFYEVPNASRGGMRPATVKDALKVAAEPSVTEILNCAAKPQLTEWLVNTALDAVLTLPRLPDESLDAFKERARRDSQEQAKKARDDGGNMHNAIENYLKGGFFDQKYLPHIKNAEAALKEIGIDWHEGLPEKSFCLPGQYGGRIDLTGPDWIVDYKGIDDLKLEAKQGWPDHVRQLSGYSNGLNRSRWPRLVNVFIGRASGGVKLREWTPAEADKGFAEFEALVRFYRISKGFDVGLKVAA